MTALPFMGLMTWLLLGLPAGLRAVLHDASGREVGTVEVEEAPGAIRILARLHHVEPGSHGFHIHAGTACGAAPFDEAGPHFDPEKNERHSGPLGSGHAGDLGNIVIDEKGKGKLELFTRRLALGSDSTGVAGRAIVLHANPDNLTDDPANGGSGARVACGVLVAH